MSILINALGHLSDLFIYNNNHYKTIYDNLHTLYYNLKNTYKIDKKNTNVVWDTRTIGLGAQILSDLGIKKMRLLSAPKHIHALSGFGLEIVEYIND